MLQTQMKALFRHMAQTEMLSRTKEYVNALKEIDGMLMKKVSTIAKVGYLTTCILNGEEVKKQHDLEQGLTAKRAAMVGEVRAWAEEHRPKASGKTGRKRGTGEKKPKPEKGSTYEKTYSLRKSGWSLEQIAAERSMAKSTIEGHFARGIAEGAIEIDGLMPSEERDAIADWMREHPAEGLNEAQKNFAGRFSYGQLRMVQAWVKKQE